MEEIEIEERVVPIPEDVKISLSAGKVEVSGPLGTLPEDLSHMPVKFELREGGVAIHAPWPKTRDVAMVGTAASSIKNLIKGVTKGFTYKLKIVYSHFPITVKVDNERKRVFIENFMGEKSPRTAKIVGNVKIEVKGDDVIVQGLNLKEVSQTAANIELATKVKDKDQRVFLDGIYVYEKKEGLERG
ncbi:TPA: 50S ribosomal protein L6 [Candidatus Bathyarchaeota archaeon]|nr:50S ribosomal protein L6 [Candidatus Bathyarchaeota archaeon]